MASCSVDKDRALAAFRAYASAYDPDNPRIALKVDHTLRVAELCERIARGIGLLQIDIDVAWLIGLLHDIGRFEQVKRYDTFNDAASVSHAALGAQVLFDEMVDGAPRIRTFVDCVDYDELIRTAIELHSAYELPATLGERARTLCNVLRDADKLDIIKVNCICPIEDVYGMPERAMVESELSDECVALFYEHRCLPRGVRTYPADIMLGHICFAWELVYDESRAIAREQGCLRQMLTRTWAREETQAAFDAMAAHMHDELGI